MKVHYCVIKNPPPPCVQGLVNVVSTLMPFCFKNHFSIILICISYKHHLIFNVNSFHHGVNFNQTVSLLWDWGMWLFFFHSRPPFIQGSNWAGVFKWSHFYKFFSSSLHVVTIYCLYNTGFSLHFATSWPLNPRERDPLHSVQSVGWVPWTVWTTAENLAPRFDPRTFQPIATCYTDWAASTYLRHVF